MYNWLSTILTNIAALLKANGTNAITGDLAGAQLTDDFTKIYADLLSILGLKGKATAGTNPGVPSEAQVWLTGVPSVNNVTYTHFGGVTVPAFEMGILAWDNVGAAWSYIKWFDYHFQNTDTGTNKYTFDIGAGAGAVDVNLEMKGLKVLRIYHVGGRVQISPDDGTSWYDLPETYTHRGVSVGVGSHTYAIPDDAWIDKISVLVNSPICELKVGTTLGGDEIIPHATYPATSPATLLTGGDLYIETGQDIYLTVISGDCNIRIDYKPRYID